MKKTLIALFLTSLSLGASASNGKLDAIYYGGDIVTMDERLKNPEAVGIMDGKITSVGLFDHVKENADPNTRYINLKGQTLMPGFVEPHVHIIGTAFSEEIFLDLSHFTLPNDTLDSIVQRLKDASDKIPDGGWVLGFGVDPSRTNPFMAELTADILDKVSTTKPVFVINQSMHIAYVNHKALEVAGIDDNTPNPPGGGMYVKDSNGHLTGKLIEPPSYDKFLKTMPLPSQADILAAIQKTGQKLTKQGVTTSAEIALGSYLGVDKEYEMINNMTHNGTLPVRVRGYLYAEAFPITNQSYKPNQGDDTFRLIGYKILSDGSNQGLTGAMKQPYQYPENTSNKGQLNYTQQDLLNNIQPRFKEGWQISVHANGDRAIEETLSVYEQLVKTPEDAKKRLRIEHFSIPTEQEIKKAKKLGVVPGFTVGHTDYWGEAFHDHLLGPERANRLDPSASLLKEGMHFAYHSDSPVSPINPLKYASEGASRLWQAKPQKVLNGQERISNWEALKRITIDAAYQVKMETKIGSITPGKYADFVVLSQNPLKTGAYEIRDIQVNETWLNGQKVYQKNK